MKTPLKALRYNLPTAKNGKNNIRRVAVAMNENYTNKASQWEVKPAASLWVCLRCWRR